MTICILVISINTWTFFFYVKFFLSLPAAEPGPIIYYFVKWKYNSYHVVWNCCYLFLDPTCWRRCIRLLNQMQEFSSWLLRNWQKWRRKKCFLNPVWAVFCPLYPPPLLPKSLGFLDWWGVFMMLNSFLLYLVFKVG